MVTKKPRIVIIGAGMAGLTAANKLYTSSCSKQLFELSVVEGGTRIGGRINSSEFCGDRIEQGATWIHGIEGSPVYKIAQETNLLNSHQPWECMDGISEDPVTVAEGGHPVNPSLVEPISSLFKNLMDFIQGKPIDADGFSGEILKHCCGSGGGGGHGNLSVGTFLRRGLEAYWALVKDEKGVKGMGNWSRKALEEAIFSMHESIQRTFTSADDLCTLDYNAEKEYIMFPGEEITIARGYSSVIESLASVLPVGMIQLGRKVEKIEWQACEPDGIHMENGHDNRPVKLHFCDGSIMTADHVIVTVSLGVLKKGISQDSGMFNPPLPSVKTGAISRLGYGVVNKVFLQLSPPNVREISSNFPFLQMVFHQPDSESKHPKIPQWIRKTSFLCPIYSNSRVVLSWFTGQEALELESLTEEEIITGFSTTVSNLLPSKPQWNLKPNGTGINHGEIPQGKEVKFEKVLRTQWGTNPLFLGSYSYVAVGSSIDDMDTLAEPLPQNSNLDSTPSLQILFAGEATHKTHYSTTHGAYFSGLREANRLLKHYNYIGV
ncbi:Flavin-containing amine oxidase [Handroanthus impetiginosus]|uniref:Flavin-containing amine oxidase n=1 Tax=Handroanthus impetiginosus TaxID=429701 RepID=A0A2G9I5V9_9LAMI|nr:Flavin-containing amine oxidase [Handroanthus impetiginosus]